MTDDTNYNENANKAYDEMKQATSEFKEGARQTLNSTENKKILAGVLGIIFGGLGIHKFILGYNKEGGILLGATLLGILLSCLAVGFLFVWIPGVIGLIEGIIYLTKTDAEFYETYQLNKRPWF